MTGAGVRPKRRLVEAMRARVQRGELLRLCTYVTKPFSTRDLAAKVRYMLGE